MTSDLSTSDTVMKLAQAHRPGPPENDPGRMMCGKDQSFLNKHRAEQQWATSGKKYKGAFGPAWPAPHCHLWCVDNDCTEPPAGGRHWKGVCR